MSNNNLDPVTNEAYFVKYNLSTYNPISMKMGRCRGLVVTRVGS